MFFSKRMTLQEFLHIHYKPTGGYRLTLETKTNTCVYADIEYIRVPNFKNCLPIEVDEFEKMMLNREWPSEDSRFKELYVYIMEEEVLLCDRDNIEIQNFKEECLRPQLGKEVVHYETV